MDSLMLTPWTRDNRGVILANDGKPLYGPSRTPEQVQAIADLVFAAPTLMAQLDAANARIAELEESLRDMIFYFADAAVYDEDEIAVVDNARSLLAKEAAQ